MRKVFFLTAAALTLAFAPGCGDSKKPDEGKKVTTGDLNKVTPVKSDKTGPGKDD